MVTPTDIKQYLSQAYYIGKRMYELQVEIAECKGKAMKSTTAWSDTPSGGHSTSSPQAVWIEKELLIRDKLSKEELRLLDAEESARDLIWLLPSEREKLFLEDYHLRRMKFDEIGFKRNYSARQVYRIIGDAYRHLAEIVNADALLTAKVKEAKR